MKKVVLALSGGVDSAVSALILQKQGYDIVAVFFRLNNNYTDGEEKARKIARKLKIKFYPINIAEIFNNQVIEYFIDSYQKGITPNPCIKCNKTVKIKELNRVRKELGADLMATGHYSRITRRLSHSNNFYQLRKGIDESKDQSYFLYRLGQNELKHLIFPLGELKKDDVKKIAKKNKLNIQKGESQDICFLVREGKIIDHNDFLKEHLKLKPGPIRLISDNTRIGVHQGLPLYTLGQRRGVEIGGTGPYYVVKTDYQSNTLYVSKNADDPKLSKKKFNIKKTNWINPVKFPLRCELLFRYRHKPVECVVAEDKNGKTIVKLDKPERAITPGQSAVFYDGDVILGGGIIV